MDFANFIMKFINKNKWKRVALFAEYIKGFDEIAKYI